MSYSKLLLSLVLLLVALLLGCKKKVEIDDNHTINQSVENVKIKDTDDNISIDIFEASKNGHLDIIKYLISKGAGVNIR